MNLRFTVAYDGRYYRGWQRQHTTDRTIQGKLEDTLSRYFGQPLSIHGSGRTDAGVHAIGQVFHVHVKDPGEADLDTHLRALNDYLPADIVLRDIASVPPRFHSRYWAAWKRYRYTVETGIPDPLHRHYAWQIPDPLAIEAMEAGADRLVGTHDYVGFQSTKPGKRSTERTVYRIGIDVAPTRDGGQRITIDLDADGFLYHMGRYLAGTLVACGRGEHSAETLEALLHSQDRDQAGELAPAHGLCLMAVGYAPYPKGGPSAGGDPSV